MKKTVLVLLAMVMLIAVPCLAFDGYQGHEGQIPLCQNNKTGVLKFAPMKDVDTTIEVNYEPYCNTRFIYGTTTPTETLIWINIQGIQGPQGIQGIQGEKGDQGIQGLQGLQGIQGDKGDKGDQGIQGIQGLQGIKGDKGDQGIQGLQGLQGIQGDKGDKGDQGIQGIQGIQGEQGIQGPQGEPGICLCPPCALGALVANYQMNDGSGLVVSDSTSYQNHGYIGENAFVDPYPQPNAVGVQWGAGVLDYPIGSTGDFAIGCNASLQFSTYLGIETSFLVHSLSDNNYLISKGYLLSDTGSFGVNIAQNSIDAWIMHGGTMYHSISGPVITTEQYYKLFVVYDSAARVLRLWLDDQEVAYSVQQAVPGDGLIYTGPCSLAAPRHVNGAILVGGLYGYGSYNFHGTIDYLKLYNLF